MGISYILLIIWSLSPMIFVICYICSCVFSQQSFGVEDIPPSPTNGIVSTEQDCEDVCLQCVTPQSPPPPPPTSRISNGRVSRGKSVSINIGSNFDGEEGTSFTRAETPHPNALYSVKSKAHQLERFHSVG